MRSRERTRSEVVSPVRSNRRTFDAVDYMARHDHEQLALFRDRATGVRALIALHDTTLGPGLGGTRIRQYASPSEGVQDVLRLAEGMTYKAAVAGLPFGGGKAVILADGSEADDAELRAARFRAFGCFLDSLGGRFITAEDAGTSLEDMRQIRLVTRYVVGTPREEGGGGDPSPTTAYGVTCGMRALAEDVLQRPSLEGVRVAVQGLGHVGMSLAERLVRAEGAVVIAADVRAGVAQEAQARFADERRFTLVAPDQIHAQACDIFAPCAFGAVLNPVTIPQLQCQVVAGAANNQLEDEVRDSEALRQRGITYAVDYVINAGGLIHAAQDFAARGRWSPTDDDIVHARVARIYDTVKRMLARAHEEDISTVVAARRMAVATIQADRLRTSGG